MRWQIGRFAGLLLGVAMVVMFIITELPPNFN